MCRSTWVFCPAGGRSPALSTASSKALRQLVNRPCALKCWSIRASRSGGIGIDRRRLGLVLMKCTAPPFTLDGPPLSLIRIKAVEKGDDAPEWLTSRPRKRANLGVVLAGVIGMVVTLGALTLAGQAFMKNTVKNLAANSQQTKPKPVAEITRPEPTPRNDWDKIVEEQARRDAMSRQRAEQPTSSDSPATKQTVFNDQNYTPRGAINLVDAREWGTAEPYEQTRKRQE